MSALLDSLLTPAQRAEAAAAAPAGPVWVSMTEAERRNTLNAMQEFGGSFVASLAVTWRLADAINSQRLGHAMADYVRKYGPGSTMYAMVERRGN